MATSVTKVSTQKRGGVIFQTNNSDITPAVTFATKPNSAYQIDVKGTAFRAQDDTEAAAYWRRALFRTNAAGAVTQVGGTQTPSADLEDAAGWDFLVAISGTNIQISVGGEGTPTYWNIDWRIWVVDTVPQA